MDRKPSPPSMCAMNMWCCTGFTEQSGCAGASKCSASTIRKPTITGAIPKLTRPLAWSSEPRGFNTMAANDHDNAPHGDNIISQGETVADRPLASEPVPEPEDLERQSERQDTIADLHNRTSNTQNEVALQRGADRQTVVTA